MDVKETGVLGDDIHTHWYYASKARFVSDALRSVRFSTILDVGAGSGFFSRHLLRTTDARSAWCVDTAYDGDSDSSESGKPLHFRTDIGPVHADLTLFMDVLEHVDDDAGLLREYSARVPSGSHFFMTVPAFQFLWSGHDDFLEHRRRYTLVQLEDTIHRAGLEMVHGAYCFSLVFPLAAAMRLLPQARNSGSQLKRHAPWVNTLLTNVCSMERAFARYNRLAGLTALCLARKV